MKVYLPSGRVVKVPTSVAATASTLADFCPDRHEHTPTGGKGYVATVHPSCGLAVVWVRKANSRAIAGPFREKRRTRSLSRSPWRSRRSPNGGSRNRPPGVRNCQSSRASEEDGQHDHE